MNLKELRIGNKVLFTDSPHQGIRTITGADLAYAEKNPDWFKFFLSPIPITEQWLLKFGFKKNNEGRYDNRMELSYDGKYYIFKQGWTYIELKSIHQLQNLYFSLTGQELELQ